MRRGPGPGVGALEWSGQGLGPRVLGRAEPRDLVLQDPTGPAPPPAMWPGACRGGEVAPREPWRPGQGARRWAGKRVTRGSSLLSQVGNHSPGRADFAQGHEHSSSGQCQTHALQSPVSGAPRSGAGASWGGHGSPLATCWSQMAAAQVSWIKSRFISRTGEGVGSPGPGCGLGWPGRLTPQAAEPTKQSCFPGSICGH